ncbi:MAG: TadE/TadG family type IV pilus assembly protein [Terracidiphilus sp.]
MNRKNAQSGRLVGLAAQALRGIRASRFSSWLLRSRALTREGGASLVETAFAYAILIPLLFGAIEFGYMFYTYQNIADASRKAARWAAVHGSSAPTACTGGTASQTNCNASAADIQAYVEHLNYPGVSFSASNVAVSFLCVTYNNGSASWTAASGTTCPSGTYDPGGPANAPGNEVQVTVTHAFPLMIAYWKATTVKTSSTGSMMIDY